MPEHSPVDRFPTATAGSAPALRNISLEAIRVSFDGDYSLEGSVDHDGPVRIEMGPRIGPALDRRVILEPGKVASLDL